VAHRKFSISEAVFRRIHLFKYVQYESVIGLVESCLIKELPPQEILISPGQPNNAVYFILEGRLRVHLGPLESDPIIILDAGESVGEMSVIDRQPTSALVIADERCRLMVMSEDLLWSLVQSSHAAACNLLFTLTKRLRHTDHVITENVHMDEVYQRYGNVDALTGLHNRHWLDNAMKRQCQRCATNGTPFSIIMVDIDHFKRINDLHGHLCGDRILYWLANILTDHLRPSEVVARYGGDEFIILLPDMAIGNASEVAKRLHKCVKEAPPVVVDGKKLDHPTISAGIACLKAAQTPEMLIAEADAALYRAKENGRNCTST
jgi:diguanylate cyclase (GGDEF)-like protein